MLPPWETQEISQKEGTIALKKRRFKRDQIEPWFGLEIRNAIQLPSMESLLKPVVKPLSKEEGKRSQLFRTQ